MPASLTIDFGKPLPLFPLPNCVLLPHATLPLHIFEQRYRRMVCSALDSRGLIAMALFDGEDWKQNYEGNPPLRKHVCIGYVNRHHRLDNGRYNILLQGVCRASIVEEVQTEPFRAALLCPTETQVTMEIDLDDHRARMEKLLTDPLLHDLSSVSAINNWLSNEIPTLTLIDLAAMNCSGCMEERYAFLAEPDARKRAALLEALLEQLRRTMAMVKRSAPEPPSDHLSRN